MHSPSICILLILATCFLGTNAIRLRQTNSQQTIQYAAKQPPLTTPWTDKVGTNPWPEYPRPQFKRSKWKNLNGIWQYQSASGLDAVQNPPFEQPFTNEVLVPSCLESGLSGLQEKDVKYSWLKTNFTVPSSFNRSHVLLNFGAVDYEATVFINGKQAGFHRGGYFHFAVDITQYLSFEDENELLVFTHDPTDSDNYVIPVGKQRLTPDHMFYTPCSGIWQSVWIEAVPEEYITQLDLDANMHGQLNVTVHTATKNGTSVEVKVYDGHEEIGSGKHTSDQPFHFNMSNIKLWSPKSPKLYNVTVTMGTDTVESYIGFRTISKGTVDGVTRPLLNGQFVFMFGTLDQGYWPDGLYTPPTKDAMVYDLKFLKDLGFNMVRKHIKVEPALFYRACDEMGLLVIQDMPSLTPLQTKTNTNGDTVTILPDEAQQQEFTRQLELLVTQLKNHPSIVIWTIYNEGWGQIIDDHPEFNLTELVKQWDPTKLVDATSGWHDHGAGDFSDNHHYASPQCGTPFYSQPSSPYDSSRIAIQGEFGGLGHEASIDHLWNVKAALDTINNTYEMAATLEAWNYRSHMLLQELEDQIHRFNCSAGVWTQTTDVEGETNGLMTYDRRMKRVEEKQWKADIRALYDAAAARSNSTHD
ncbi:uncharacterized protein ATNIH1004_010725 [Aspergillus tanneri]|uniref:Uncharacterized protein n=1 Tax=Aspergillus tanneri TaxID=1220188 RepID=A0A5M9M867_9EURO|nr:uncharacterized protein ATNIH1004_010725 [Aspergillus tanneri]KAA8641786.1 hypothetical protein ATNIH1004_010725 [Aspergillus tanneri]